MKQKILVVDDDPDLRKTLRATLERENYEIAEASDANEMKSVFAEDDFDLVVLDLMLPGEDGLSLTRYLKERSNVGVIILTGKGESVDLIIGLEMGADDYVAKPYNRRELLARIKSVLRRSTKTTVNGTPERSGTHVNFSGWSLDLPHHKLAAPDGTDVPLTMAEFQLLRVLLETPGQPVDREQLSLLIFNKELKENSRNIDALVRRLRQKLEIGQDQQQMIKSVRGSGYTILTTLE
ncbi:response regulator [Sneathiella chinensis]|uniref:DNA-binding response regulator n=1 Tax=Sneathiella chinensis TaxID=349750 RepID=A0ABQ5U1V3_9PROT|nr:response regulator [Sneathiella chinensis]GLQ05322.1 DNA-binding response regulator [Sneathiella chinensis]